ncbi:sigma-54-dependent Fis family transcriptional regulator [Pseudomonas umsongensis]|jgi:DNA-binding NtrC family response regulator|uniref:Sigma-54-dependent Fis family transcriptional regulator n=1 Tax=Pseudomonas umsongensis TaxID=198618 RepID=A0ABX4E0A0_9PSED|nr:sigma-54-dependent Fis family transcriptional regulator [Pseudomonas umsongensis]OXR35055.1 sigma-54-dependent Fis family transcriptional regulator [Pseudomonas umsongensis]QFG30271.1 sigma-54-dependent Fis family transcriptional regulator [Pseudomonas umsongensis]SDT20547.1 V4R domain-containing protein [Pseudomonas umsongensis]
MTMKYRASEHSAQLKDLTDRVHFLGGEGKIWLDEQRMMLMQVSAMASFRRELIEMIGAERAKGFFLRLGYQSGLKDAQLARKLRPNASDIDMFLIGPQLHSLKGMVKVRPLKMDIDIEAGTFYADIEWIDSFEVENHQSEQLHSDQPICWMLLGYAISYSSFFIGRQIIYKEVSCRGCGDTMCRIIGKPAEEWEDADTFMRYFQSDSIIDELHTLQLQVENMNQRLQLGAGQFYGIGRSAIYRKTCDLIDKVAPGKASVLLLGETGVGKEVIARSLHLRSERAGGPFIALNCAAISPDLIEAELFGVEKGAYTGAQQARMGRFERAHGGTLFLDEIIELTPRAQASLLRVLQEGELERVGDNQTRTVDVRVIGATHEDLAQAVKEGRFRADLYYRLNVYPVRVPALRERREDIPLLIEHFLEKLHQSYQKKTLGLSDRASEACLRYDWPGNIRELQNLIERGVIITDSNQSISVEALFPHQSDEAYSIGLSSEGALISQKLAPTDEWVGRLLDLGVSLEAMEEQLLQGAMERAGQNVSEAARLLGMTRPALAYRLKKKPD